MRLSRRAFTLIEVLIVLLIIGILIAIGLYKYQSVVESTYDKDAQSALRASVVNAESVRTTGDTFRYETSISNLVGKLNAKSDGLNFIAWSSQEPSTLGLTPAYNPASPKNILVSLQPNNTMVVFCNHSKSDTYFCLGTGSANLSTFASNSGVALSNQFVAALSVSFTSSSVKSSLAPAYCTLATPSGSLPRGCGGTDPTDANGNGIPDVDEIGPNLYPLPTGVGPGTWFSPAPVTALSTVSIVSGPTEGQVVTASNSVSFGFSGDQSPTRYECKLDASPYTSCTRPVNYTPISNGNHVFSVRAINAIGTGNPTTRSFSVNYITPATGTVSAPSGGVIQVDGTGLDRVDSITAYYTNGSGGTYTVDFAYNTNCFAPINELTCNSLIQRTASRLVVGNRNFSALTVNRVVLRDSLNNLLYDQTFVPIVVPTNPSIILSGPFTSAVSGEWHSGPSSSSYSYLDTKQVTLGFTDTTQKTYKCLADDCLNNSYCTRIANHSSSG